MIQFDSEITIDSTVAVAVKTTVIAAKSIVVLLNHQQLLVNQQ
jgi:hypothetical protein